VDRNRSAPRRPEPATVAKQQGQEEVRDGRLGVACRCRPANRSPKMWSGGLEWRALWLDPAPRPLAGALPLSGNHPDWPMNCAGEHPNAGASKPDRPGPLALPSQVEAGPGPLVAPAQPRRDAVGLGDLATQPAPRWRWLALPWLEPAWIGVQPGPRTGKRTPWPAWRPGPAGCGWVTILSGLVDRPAAQRLHRKPTASIPC